MKNSSKSIFQLGVRQKVLLVLMCVLLTALTASGWLALQEEKANTLNEIDNRGSDISRFVAKSLVYSVIGYDYHTLDLLLKEITLSDDIGYSKIVNLKGNTMAEAGILIENNPNKMVLFKEMLVLNDEVVGNLTLGISTEKTMTHIENQKYALIKREAFIILLIALGEILALSYIIIKPVSIISKTLNEREDNNPILGRIPLDTKDEFGELAKQFNDLSDNLNMANAELQSRVDYADKQLVQTNNVLLERSSELLDLNKKFEKLSITDPLTELYNRRHFEKIIADEMSVTKRHGDVCSLLVIDIDKFKHVNDTYGHMHGDTVIKMIADTMKERFRETDVLCRIGGEEFVALCKRSDKNESIQLAEEIRETIENTSVNIGNQNVKVTVSIGIETVAAENIVDVGDDIFKHADLALYYSKDNGRNKVTHFNDMT